MGFSHSWIALKGLEPSRALEVLGVEVQGELEADELPRRLAMGELPGGWLLFLSADFDDAFKGPLAKLTTLAPALACAVEEHVMVSEARGYEDGAEVWRVIHDPEHGVYHLDATGNLPGVFEEVRDKARAEQDENGGEDAGVDYLFEAPSELSRELCGFRLGFLDPLPAGLRELRKIGEVGGAPARQGLFARLFGRR